VLHRQREEVDQFLAGMPQDVRADNPIRLLVDQDFCPGGGLGIGAARQPIV
jgi:hypothetical protein